MNSLGPKHLVQISQDVRGMARRNPLSEVFEFRNTSLDEGPDIRSRIEHVMVSVKLGDTFVLTSMKCKVLSKRRRQEATSKFKSF